MLSMLSASSTLSTLDMDQPLFSDRGVNRFGQMIISPNAKAALWFTVTGDLQIHAVINPADFIVNDPDTVVKGYDAVLCDPSKRYLVYSLFNSNDAAKKDLGVNFNLNQFSQLFLRSTGIEIETSLGKKGRIFEWAPGIGFIQLKVEDDGNLTVTRGGKPIWNLFAVIQPPAGSNGDSAKGFNLGSLLIPGIALAALLYLKK